MMRKSLILNAWWPKTIWILICVAVSFFGVAFLQGWGDVWKDEAYQTWSILNWKSSRVAPLTYWIGYKWMSIFGFKVINLRLLTTIIGSLAVTTSVAYSYYRTKNIILTGLLLMLGAWVWRADAFMLYNWDSGSYLYDCIGLICVVEYFRRPSIKKAAFCGISCALMALGRLPSGIVVPFMCVLMVCYGIGKDFTKKKTIQQIFVLGISFFIVFLGLLILMYGNVFIYLNTLSDGMVGGHSLRDLGAYKWRMFALLDSFCSLYLPAFLCILLPLIYRKRLSMALGCSSWKLSKGQIITIVLLCLMTLIVTMMIAKLYVSNLAECEMGCAAPIVVAFLLLPSVRNFAYPIVSKIKIPIWQLWGCGAIVIAVIFGSDAYTERIEAGFVLPIIVSVLWTKNNKSVNFYLSVVLVLWLMCCIVINIVHWDRQLKNCTNLYGSEIGFYSGVQSSVDFNKIMNDVKPAIKEIKQNGERYILIDDRVVMGLVLGQDDGPVYHDFGFSSDIPASWKERHFNMLDSIDAVVYRKDWFRDRIEVQQMVKILEAYGYLYKQDVGGAIVIRKRRYQIQ